MHSEQLVALALTGAISCSSLAAAPPELTDADKAALRAAQEAKTGPGGALTAAAETGNLAKVRELIRAAEGQPYATAAFRLHAGNVLFSLADFPGALEQHGLIARDAALAPSARMEILLDLAAERRFPEACAQFKNVPATSYRSAYLQSVRADLLLRCGQPREGLALLLRIFREDHDSAEEGLVSVFGPLRRFKRYRFELEQRVAAAAPGSRRALGELELCGDFENPWRVKTDYRRSADLFRTGVDADCVGLAREAVAHTAELLTSSDDAARAAKLTAVRSRLDSQAAEPGCEEVVLARHLLLDDSSQAHLDEQGRWVQLAAPRFPKSRIVRELLLESYVRKGQVKEHRAEFEQATRDFPGDWYPWTQLALIDAEDESQLPIAIRTAEQGLARLPDSVPLNYVLALLRLTRHEYDLALAPATRLLAGLLETQRYHHDWDIGIAAVRAALDHKDILTEGPKTQLARAQTMRTVTSLYHPWFQSKQGCFSSGGRAVAPLQPDYQPEIVLGSLARD